MKKYILVFLSLSFVFVLHPKAFAQWQKKQKHYTIYISKRDTLIQADVLAKKQVFTACTGKTYYWYASTNDVIQTMGGYSGKPLQGNYISFYGNNNLREKGKFRKGLKKGEWISWFSNGKIKEISHWKKGVKQGKIIMYNETGQEEAAARFRNDKLNGKMTNYHEGKVISKIRYRNGKEIPHKEKFHEPKGKKIKQKPEKKKEKKSFKEWLKGVRDKFRSKKDKPKKDTKDKTTTTKA